MNGASSSVSDKVDPQSDPWLFWNILIGKFLYVIPYFHPTLIFLFLFSTMIFFFIFKSRREICIVRMFEIFNFVNKNFPTQIQKKIIFTPKAINIFARSRNIGSTLRINKTTSCQKMSGQSNWSNKLAI